MSHHFSRRRWLAGLAVGALTATPLTVLAAASPAQAAPVDIQILATNDFHGRIMAPSSAATPASNTEAGAAQFAGAVAQLEADFTPGGTAFVAAGDLIGASTFESFIQKDKPTLDALNAAGLDVSAAGNHEFDAGYKDLVNRVMAPASAANPDGGANWQYLAANVRKTDGSYALPDVTASPGTSDGATWTTTLNGVKVGFVGAVTEDLPALVSPDGMTDVKVTGIVSEVNTAADKLKADGADLVIMLVHEGAANTSLAAVTDTTTTFGKIVAGVNKNVGAIISGHTHLAYNHMVNGRPVVSAGQYGTNLNKLVFTVDPDTDAVSVKSSEIVSAYTTTLTAQVAKDKKTEVEAIVKAAGTKADSLGSVELGKLAAAFNRAKLADAKTENRGGESTLGNLVAEVHRASTGAQIAFMNPGGLRADMLGNNTAGYPAALTYKQAAVVQPFANTLTNMKLTGAAIKEVLEQQWQRDSAGNVPSRPYLQMGTSSGFTYTFDPAAKEGERITGMWLKGDPIKLDATYSVTANSFLAAGGDNFRAFSKGTDKKDTGKADLAAMVDYMKANSPVGPDATQHAVGVSFPAGAPASYAVGDHVKFSLSSLAYSAATDAKDATVEVRAGDVVLGTATVDNTLGTTPTDEYGKAEVDVVLTKAGAAALNGAAPALTVVGNNTKTTVSVPIKVTPEAAATMTAKAVPGAVRVMSGRTTITASIAATGGAVATGDVEATVDGKSLGKVALVNGVATFKTEPFRTIGRRTVTLSYEGDGRVGPATGRVDFWVVKAPVTIRAYGSRKVKRNRVVSYRIDLDALGFTPRGAVTMRGGGMGEIAKIVRGGEAKFKLRLKRLGKQRIVIMHHGSDRTLQARKVIWIQVRR